MKIKNRITRIIEEEKLLSGDDTFDDILRRLKSNPAYLPSLSTVVKIAEKYDLSADFVLGLTDSPTPLLNKLDTDFVSVNLKKFAQTFPTKFYLLKKLGLTKDFPSFSLAQRQKFARHLRLCQACGKIERFRLRAS